MNRSLEVPSQRRLDIFNFRQFALTLLGHHGHHLSWPSDALLLDELERQELAKEVADELGLRALSERDACQAIERLRNNRRPEQDTVPAASLLELRAAYERRLHQLRVNDFGGADRTCDQEVDGNRSPPARGWRISC